MYHSTQNLSWHPQTKIFIQKSKTITDIRARHVPFQQNFLKTVAEVQTWLATLVHNLSDFLEALAAALQRVLLSLQGFPLRLLCCLQISITLCHAAIKILLLLPMPLAVRLPLAIVIQLVLGMCLVLNMGLIVSCLLITTVLLPFSGASAFILLLMLAQLLVSIKILTIISLPVFFLFSVLTILLVLTVVMLLALLLHGLSDFQEPLTAVIQGVVTDQHGFTLCLLC
jgi:hypothetical protein